MKTTEKFTVEAIKSNRLTNTSKAEIRKGEMLVTITTLNGSNLFDVWVSTSKTFNRVAKNLKLKDPKFQGYVDLEMKKVRHARTKALEDHPGARLKMSAFNDLEDKGMLTAKQLIFAFSQIHYGGSKLSARERKFIKEIIFSAMMVITDQTKAK